jgi:hypothetical protein
MRSLTLTEFTDDGELGTKITLDLLQNLHHQTARVLNKTIKASMTAAAG